MSDGGEVWFDDFGLGCMVIYFYLMIG